MSVKRLIYRMIHIDNLDYILHNGMWSMKSNMQDSNFVPIGNTDIIQKRQDYSVKVVPPGGVLGEYVPFYFSGHSPMLLNIVTGHGVEKRKQADVVFVVCDADEVMDSHLEWCFTDGHAKKAITKFYNKKSDLENLDWAAIQSTYWADTEEDSDRQRKKMSEFLIRENVPVGFIKKIVTCSEESSERCRSLVCQLGLSIPVETDRHFNLYYKNHD